MEVFMSEIKAAPPIPGDAASMTPERREWMRAVLSHEEANVPGVGWHEWLGSALLALNAAEVRALEAERATAWRDDLPPEGVFVWREGRVSPVETEHIRGKLHYLGTNGDAFLWGSARWAPIHRPI